MTCRPATSHWRSGSRRWRRCLVLAACLACVMTPPATAQVRGTYLYSLSGFTGRVPYDWARVVVDREREETYVVYQNLVRIFNGSGMEIFSFGDDLDLGQILDVAVDARGDILVLSLRDARSIVTRCSFRGVPTGQIPVTGLPAGLAFAPNRMALRGGTIYFANLGSGDLIVTDGTGVFQRHVSLRLLLDVDDKQRNEAEIAGFSVDGEGNVFFTVPTLFRAFKLSTDGTIASFGRPGSAPGRFGIVAGIVSDSRGHVLVVDKLKCAILVFDKAFNFLTEFGTRGARPENLIVPDDIAIDARDRLYVTQGRRRGVSVFALTGE